MTGGLPGKGRTSYMIVYAFGVCRIPADFYDIWSLKDLNGYLSFSKNMNEARGKKTGAGKVYTERNLDELLLGGRKP